MEKRRRGGFETHNYYCRRSMGFLFGSRVKNAFKSLEIHTSHSLKDSDVQNLKETYVRCFWVFYMVGIVLCHAVPEGESIDAVYYSKVIKD